MPSELIAPHANSPEHVPIAVGSTMRDPPRRTLRSISAMSGPGETVRSAATPVNARMCGSTASMAAPVLPDDEPRDHEHEPRDHDPGADLRLALEHRHRDGGSRLAVGPSAAAPRLVAGDVGVLLAQRHVPA